jgi:hypothetical protein
MHHRKPQLWIWRIHGLEEGQVLGYCHGRQLGLISSYLEGIHGEAS